MLEEGTRVERSSSQSETRVMADTLPLRAVVMAGPRTTDPGRRRRAPPYVALTTTLVPAGAQAYSCRSGPFGPPGDPAE